MAVYDASPFFSIVIPTRNRPALLQRALESVKSQTFGNLEILVVVDGSGDQYLKRYRDMDAHSEDISFVYLDHRAAGHGQSYSMNVGVACSTGNYLCFLDDDDFWTDDFYLETVHASITASNKPVDLHYSNQKAFYSDGSQQTKSVWLEDLIPRVADSHRNEGDSYFVDATFLLQSKGFAHLNCSIFSRALYDAIGGMDESIRYENDRDVYIRSIDTAKVILFSTRYASRHNIPDMSRKENMSTVGTSVDKKLYQLRVYDKGICLCTTPAVVKTCRLGKAYELKHLAQILAREKQFRQALHYAREALLNGFNFRWLGYCLYLASRSAITHRSGH